MRHLLFVSLAFTALACGPVITDGAPADPDAAPQPGSTTSTSSDPQPDGGASQPAPGKLPFAVSNVPSDAPLAASGDWIFNTTTCGTGTITIDTSSGKVSCDGQAPDAFTYRALTVSDPTYGDLTEALFVTRRLVIEPGMRVNVVGNRALVIVALDSVKIQGTLRASVNSIYLDRANGGGFSGVDKANGAGPGGGATAPTGAGAGSYCGAGGAGGSGAVAGKTYGNDAIVPLLGGSAGGGSEVDPGGGGGGAIQIAAGTAIEIAGVGVVDVAGGGGKEFYGTAGGAGGAILLEAPTVKVLGTLAANGGGGNAGGMYGPGATGTPDATPAAGGKNGTDAVGGVGSAGDTVDGRPGVPRTSGQALGGGSGGGGGAGRIRINATTATIGAAATISPSLATKCATPGKLAAQ